MDNESAGIWAAGLGKGRRKKVKKGGKGGKGGEGKKRKKGRKRKEGGRERGRGEGGESRGRQEREEEEGGKRRGREPCGGCCLRSRPPSVGSSKPAGRSPHSKALTPVTLAQWSLMKVC